MRQDERLIVYVPYCCRSTLKGTRAITLKGTLSELIQMSQNRNQIAKFHFETNSNVSKSQPNREIPFRQVWSPPNPHFLGCFFKENNAHKVKVLSSMQSHSSQLQVYHLLVFFYA